MAKPYKPCEIDQCNGNVNSGGARGMCAKHYQRWKRCGDPHKTKITRYYGSKCRVEGCDRKAKSKWLCAKHGQRLHKAGTTSDIPSKKSWIEDHKEYQGQDCIAWPYANCPHGRGLITVGRSGISAPRVMCEAAHGPPPTKMHQAAHSCGKGHEGCLNPNHLSWKTASENEKDKLAHGTLRRGTKINTAVLTEADVVAILADGYETKGTVLAEKFGVTPSCISDIRTGRSWSWLASAR